MRAAVFFTALACLILPPVGAEGFWLRNTDRSAWFFWWPVPAGPSGEALLGLLPGIPGGARAVAPGERVLLTPGAGNDLAGVFVPVDPPPGFLTVLTGGRLTAAGFPARGTLLADRSSFLAVLRGREIRAPLQAWGLEPFRFVLDGRSQDWEGIPAAYSWDSSFSPPRAPWPAGYPRPRTLQVSVLPGALWIRIAFDAGLPAFPRGVSASLVLRRPGTWLEWPLSGADPTVWLWTDGAVPRAVGWTAAQNGVTEGWIPFDRLTPPLRQAWMGPAELILLAAEGDRVGSYPLGAFSLGEAP